MIRMQAYAWLYILHSYRMLEEVCAVQVAYCAVDAELIYICICSISSLLWSLTKTHWIIVCNYCTVIRGVKLWNSRGPDFIKFLLLLVTSIFCAKKASRHKILWHGHIYLFMCLPVCLLACLSTGCTVMNKSMFLPVSLNHFHIIFQYINCISEYSIQKKK